MFWFEPWSNNNIGKYKELCYHNNGRRTIKINAYNYTVAISWVSHLDSSLRNTLQCIHIESYT